MSGSYRSEKALLLIALSHCTFLKNAEKLFLARRLDTLQALTVLSMHDIAELLQRVPNPRTFTLKSLPSLAEKAVKIMQRCRIEMVFSDDSDFPPLLREIPDAPFLLYYRGILPPAVPCVGMVGTRRPTGAGMKAALRIAAECGHNRIPVVSGLARGIDAFAHKGALAGGGLTAAVLACGTDQFYPRSNSRLAGSILENGGCIMSEYPPGDIPLAYRFPQRNRIISGLSRSVVVVEAPEKSGALITANFALEQGRDVCIAAGMLDSQQNGGGRTLAADGAIPIDGAADLLREWAQPALQYKPKVQDSQLPLF
ncbi:MAG: DNA-processing protein DprA [Treponema sp.]